MNRVLLMPENTPRDEESAPGTGANGRTPTDVGLRELEAVLRLAREAAPPLESATPSRPRIGLALGGGFARGLAHIGVLKVLVENHIPIDVIAGTSAGSIVGAAFASGATVEEMAEKARDIRWNRFAGWTLHRLGLARTERMGKMLAQFFHARKFEDLAIPLRILATDISTGEPVVFASGDLIPAVRGSCSFPGLFVPVEYQGRFLVDGTLISSVPVRALRDSGVDAVIGVYLKTIGQSNVPTNVFQVIGQAFQIAESHNTSTWRDSCHAVIEPELSHYAWNDYSKADEMIAEGARAALACMPAIRRLALQPGAGPENHNDLGRTAPPAPAATGRAAGVGGGHRHPS